MRNGHEVQISIVRSPSATAATPAAMMGPAYRRSPGERAGSLIATTLLVLSTAVACFDLHLLLEFAAA